MIRYKSENLPNDKSIVNDKEFKLRPFVRPLITAVAVFLSFLAMLSLFGLFIHAELASNYYANKSFIDKVTTGIVLSGPVGIGVFSGAGLLLWILRSRI